MITFKDRVKQGLSPSTVVENMDCRYMENLVDAKNTRTVIVPEQYLRMIERDSHIFDILQADAIHNRLLEISIQEATAEYQEEQDNEHSI